MLKTIFLLTICLLIGGFGHAQSESASNTHFSNSIGVALFPLGEDWFSGDPNNYHLAILYRRHQNKLNWRGLIEVEINRDMINGDSRLLTDTSAYLHDYELWENNFHWSPGVSFRCLGSEKFYVLVGAEGELGYTTRNWKNEINWITIGSDTGRNLSPGLIVDAKEPYSSHEHRKSYLATGGSALLGCELALGKRFLLAAHLRYSFEKLIPITEKKEFKGPEVDVSDQPDLLFEHGLEWPRIYALYRF
ncbi:hypothetical protein KFE98_21415 [bacterium SCSIO 12741]|nr:hypothetical protein KFE98_21415 [bacterium SCSIO 12741]